MSDPMTENVTQFPSETDHEEANTNSSADESSTQDVGGVAGQRLKSFIERVERLEEEKKILAEDIKEIYAEAKGVGFDTKTIRKLISLRKMEPEKRNEEEELLDLYKSAIGMI